MSNIAAFPQNSLVIIHLPDSTKNGVIVPVPAVVVMPDESNPVIRIRDMAGRVLEMAVSSELLSER